MNKAAFKLVFLSLGLISFFSTSAESVWARGFLGGIFSHHSKLEHPSIETAPLLELVEVDPSDERARVKKSPEELRQILDATKEVHKGNHVTTFLVWADSEKRYSAAEDLKRLQINPLLKHFRKGKIYSFVISAFPDELYPLIESEWMLSLWSGLGEIPRTEYSTYHTLAAHPSLTPQNKTLEEFYSRMPRLYEKGLISPKTGRYALRDLGSCISIFHHLSEKSDKRLADEITWFVGSSHSSYGRHSSHEFQKKRDKERRKIILRLTRPE